MRRTLKNQKPFIDAQNLLVGENHRPFNHIFQFSNIARPGIPDKPLQRIRFNRFAGPLEFHSIVLQKMLREFWNIFRSGTERRDGNRKHF